MALGISGDRPSSATFRIGAMMNVFGFRPALGVSRRRASAAPSQWVARASAAAAPSCAAACHRGWPRPDPARAASVVACARRMTGPASLLQRVRRLSRTDLTPAAASSGMPERRLPVACCRCGIATAPMARRPPARRQACDRLRMAIGMVTGVPRCHAGKIVSVRPAKPSAKADPIKSTL
jgi:hypothetical protein